MKGMEANLIDINLKKHNTKNCILLQNYEKM